MNKSSIIDVIKRRSSWRSYDASSSISDEILNELHEYINSSNQTSPFGNIARFEIVKIPESEKHKLNSEYGTYGFIKGAEYFIAGAISNEKNALMDFGYIMEDVILKATELGLGTCWMAGTFKRSTFKRDLDLKQDEILPAITPIGIPSKNRRILGQLIRFAIRAKVRKSWDKLFFNEKFEPIQVTALSRQVETALEMVRLAPSAKNKQPWRIIIDKENGLHFFIQIDPRKGYVLKYQKLDIGIALCHFELVMREFEKDGNWRISTPDIEVDSDTYHYVTSWIPHLD